MTRKEYTEQVLSGLQRLTRKEREAVRIEIDAHMEDHICDLLDLGYPEELAEERTMLRMGDPIEVGRQLNRKYPLRWLVLGRVSMVLTLVLLLVMAKPLWELGGQVKDNLMDRFAPIHELDMRHIIFSDEEGPLVQDAIELNLRQTVDGVTIRLYQAGLEDPTSDSTAWVAGCIYSENPFQKPPQLRGKVLSEDHPEVEIFQLSGMNHWMIYAPAAWGETLAFTYEQNGRAFTFCVELPWEEAVS